MSIDLDYAIKKDIRNNPVIREIDTRERREVRRIVWLAGLSVAMLLFSAWQHFEGIRYSRSIEQLKLDRAAEDVTNRQLRLNLEVLRAPQQIEKRARMLGLEPAASHNTMVIERVPSSTLPRAVVAQAH
jgi:hypothetical protein